MLTRIGTIAIEGGIYAKWKALEAERTPDGDDAQAHLGPPVGEHTVVPREQGGGTSQLFRRGMIVERANGRAFVVYGAIYDHYCRMGGTASILGQPISDEQDAPAGARVSHFDHGDIYWRQDAGIREVHGARRARTASRGDPFRRSVLVRALSLCLAALRAVARFPSRSRGGSRK